MSLYLIIFLAAPVAALAAREYFGWKLSLWSIFVAYVALGWLLVNLDLKWELARLDEAIRSTPSPPEELLREWQNDGARQVFAEYFGWAYAALYFLLCLLATRAVRAAVKKLV